MFIVVCKPIYMMSSRKGSTSPKMSKTLFRTGNFWTKEKPYAKNGGFLLETKIVMGISILLELDE